MNAPQLHRTLAINATPTTNAVQRQLKLTDLWDTLVDHRRITLVIAALFVLAGATYALLAQPTYESNLLIQVEDPTGSPKSVLGEAATIFDVKTQASAELEILRSRMVLGQAVDSTNFFLEAKPNYLPLVGEWLARKSKTLSSPGVFGLGGWVSGAEKISVPDFVVPASLEGVHFTLIASEGGRYVLEQKDWDLSASGKVGTPLTVATPMGDVRLLVSELAAQHGATFSITRNSRLNAITQLQQNLKLAEKGRQSGIIDVSLQDSDRERLVRILTAVGQQYVRQNVERKSAEAQKTLSFLDVQLPQLKRQLDQSEEAYNKYRNKQGTVALDDEARLALTDSTDLHKKLIEAQQRRRELLAKFTSEHPGVKTLDDQIAAWEREIARVNDRIRKMPTVQQDALRLERDVKINTELYQQLRNSALQLQLVREGRVGNVRIIDAPAFPEGPVKPKRSLVMALSLVIGLLAGCMGAFARSHLARGISNPSELEENTGLSVYSSVAFSNLQESLSRRAETDHKGLHLLAAANTADSAVESLRSLRTALQFSMLDAANNRIMFTGATPRLGKTFVSSNFAYVLAASGKRVLVLDCDLRRGHLHLYFGEERGIGISELVAGAHGLEDGIIRRVAPNLDLITTGTLPHNPAELFSSPRFASALAQLSSMYDYVVMDTAPVLVAADSLVIAEHAGAVLLVARAKVTRLGDINESLRRLSHAGVSAKGFVFNGVNVSQRRYGGYGYASYGYSVNATRGR